MVCHYGSCLWWQGSSFIVIHAAHVSVLFLFIATINSTIWQFDSSLHAYFVRQILATIDQAPEVQEERPMPRMGGSRGHHRFSGVAKPTVAPTVVEEENVAPIAPAVAAAPADVAPASLEVTNVTGV